MSLSNDRCAASLHRNPHTGRIDSNEGAAIFPGEDATGFNCLPAPAIKAENAVGFRNCIPSLDVRELAPTGFAGADVTMIEVTPQCFHLFCREAHHFVLTLKTGSGFERATPAISAPCL